ncbi:hypothetical protein F2Q69_00018744 [Brassica cretica]|uniref:Uncharacterized protein n=1 Tax=Brassica cretica TaxID=69181 RepID=A0A8S9QKR4_BRACR|nr:hypothetical protein F2Q69_00018744 [Brassica cretica]
MDDSYHAVSFKAFGCPCPTATSAEAFEAQLLPMFEGYMVSMKDHISKELSKLMTEVASANSSIAAVETFVKTELATLRNSTTGVDMYGETCFECTQ